MIYSLLTRDRGEMYEIVETPMHKTHLTRHWRTFCADEDFAKFQDYIDHHTIAIKVLDWDVIWDRDEK